MHCVSFFFFLLFFNFFIYLCLYLVHDFIVIINNCKTVLGRRRFSVAAPRVWNSLPLGLKTNCDSLRGFKTVLKTYLFRQDYNLPVSLTLSASDYGDFTRIMALCKLYYSLINNNITLTKCIHNISNFSSVGHGMDALQCGLVECVLVIW